MYSLQQIREYMLELTLSETTREWVQVSGKDLEEALQRGAKKLQLAEEYLEYEIVQKGETGVLGLGSQPCIIRVTPSLQASPSEVELIPEISEKFSLRRRNSQVFLKVVRSKKEAPPSPKEIAEALEQRVSQKLDVLDKIAQVVRRASGKYEPIAQFINNPQNNSSIDCTISDDKLSAFVVISPPGIDGYDITAADVKSSLHLAGVSYGIDEAAIEQLVENPRYQILLEVAHGKPAEDEHDATIEYLFPISNEKMMDNLVNMTDFREITNIPNVHEGDVVVRKQPISDGTEGVSVTGKVIFPAPGIDVELAVGANVKLSSDGLSGIAEKDGMPRLKAGVASIEPIYYVNGDVNMKVGNIHFVGAVVIKGDVLDGFMIEADGDVQVYGSVGKATLISKGNIYLQRGMAGGGEGQITAGGTVWARFLENCKVKVDEHLMVSDGIVNSVVEVAKNLICRGKRANIVGGVIYAGEFVDVKSIGAVSGVKTLIEVGVPPKLRIRDVELKEAEVKLRSAQQSLEQRISLLEHREKIEKINKKKGGEHAQPNQELISFREQRAANQLYLEELWAEVEEIRNEMEEYTTKGMVSVLRKIFPGVTVMVGDAQLPIQQEYNGVSFVYEAGVVNIQKYTETKVAIPRPK